MSLSDRPSSSNPPSFASTRGNHLLTQKTNRLLELLVRKVIRTFYGPEATVVIDALLREKTKLVRGDDIANLLRLSPKQVRTILHQLAASKLVVPYTTKIKISSTDDRVKSHTYQYFYVDYAQFVDVVRFRLRRMDDEVGMDKDVTKGNSCYACPRCHRTYTEYDYASILDRVMNKFLCQSCKTPLLESDGASHGDSNRSRREAMHRQLSSIYDILKQLESVVFPRITRALGVYSDGKVLAHAIGETIGTLGGGSKKSFVREMEYEVVVQIEPEQSGPSAASHEDGLYGFRLPIAVWRERNAAAAYHSSSAIKGPPPWMQPKWKRAALGDSPHHHHHGVKRRRRTSMLDDARNDGEEDHHRGGGARHGAVKEEWEPENVDDNTGVGVSRKRRALSSDSDSPIVPSTLDAVERKITGLREKYLKQYVEELSRLLALVRGFPNGGVWDSEQSDGCTREDAPATTPSVPQPAALAPAPTVHVQGVAMPITQVVEDQVARMSTSEYQEYYEQYKSWCDGIAAKCYRPIE